MAKSSKKGSKKASKTTLLAAVDALVPQLPVRPGLPAKDSIIKIIEPTQALAAAGPTFRIIRTNEVDEYEEAKPPSAVLAAAKKKAPGEKFGGTARKAAKLSFATANTEDFSDLRDLIESLVPDSKMKNRTPKITTAATSNRVKEEKRNISVSVFLYAASREDDNDFHLILGRDPEVVPELYMTMELSGLPPDNSSSFNKLKAVREVFKKFFKDNLDGNLPGTSYDFYDPPIPVTVEGSLFWDASHATGTRPGPKSLKSRMPVVWEVHPIRSMDFE